jgi:methyltransferase
MSVAILAAAIFLPMLGETWISTRHARALRAQGAVEPAGDVYRAMAVAYPGAFLAILAEGVLRGAPIDLLRGGPSRGLASVFVAGMAVFAAAKALKYWAIATLGPRWTFRVLVPPQSARTLSGPYRWIAHPNYLAVAGELAGAALAMRAPAAGALAVAGFGLLMWRRMAIEERALAEIESRP